MLINVSELGLWEGKLSVPGVLIDNGHSRGQQPCKFLGTRIYMRKEFISHKIWYTFTKWPP